MTTAHFAQLAPSARTAPFAARALLVLLGLWSGACVTVRPEQRAILADPTMRFEGEPGEKAALEHVYENREASFGGGSIRGGGCGCN
jgi:hypothetical protein